MDRFESMSVFVTVASAGSFSAASRQLRMPLPTVSRKVSELESHLKARLLIRSTRRLALTEVGESYVADCKRILAEVAEADRGASGQYNAPQGELFVTAPVVFGRLHVLPITAEFLAAYPQVDVRLVMADRPLNLLDEHLDVAVRIGTVPDSRLVATRVGQIRSVVCASPAYLRKHGAPKSPESLLKHDCVTFSGLAGAESWTFRSDQSVRVHSRLIVNTAEVAIDGAIAGVGFVRVLSYQISEAVKTGALAIVLKRFEPAPLPVSLIYLQDTRLTAKLRAFIDFATPRLRARLSDAPT
ncbi:MAG: LysR family transcriptional regulator [Proteobacteria bacterium]|nr:LysR family transcriptional regulator [Pseudomonadota bacterium]